VPPEGHGPAWRHVLAPKQKKKLKRKKKVKVDPDIEIIEVIEDPEEENGGAVVSGRPTTLPRALPEREIAEEGLWMSGAND